MTNQARPMEPFLSSHLVVVSADSTLVWKECDQLPSLCHGIQDSYSLKNQEGFVGTLLQWPLRCMALRRINPQNGRSSEGKREKKNKNMWSPRDANISWTSLAMKMFARVDVCIANNI